MKKNLIIFYFLYTFFKISYQYLSVVKARTTTTTTTDEDGDALATATDDGLKLPLESRLQYARTIASSILSRAPPGARLIGARGELPPLVSRLVQNASSIRHNIVDTFSCSGRVGILKCVC